MAIMRSEVVFDPRCRMDIGERSADRRAQASAMIRSLIKLLGKHAGHPPGSWQELGQPTDEYVWRDRNWTVVYRIADHRRLFRKRRTITILSVTLRI